MTSEATKLCISIAEKPGTFGREFHNAGYILLGLDYTYLPLKVNARELESILQMVRDNCKGCSVSMPHKRRAYDLVDTRYDSAIRTGAVNTILNREGHLTGFNTDYTGARALFREHLPEGLRAVLMGAGGVAHALGAALLDHGAEIGVINRTPENAERMLQKIGGGTILSPADIDNYQGHILVNATSVGMGTDETPLASKSLASFSYVMDVVIGDTKLTRDARALGKKVIPGRMLTAYQAADQFRIYTGKELPRDFISHFANP